MASREQVKHEKADPTNTLFPEKVFDTNSSDPEHLNEDNESEQLMLDCNGLPLVPQPSRFKDDPLVCPFPGISISLLIPY